MFDRTLLMIASASCSSGRLSLPLGQCVAGAFALLMSVGLVGEAKAAGADLMYVDRLTSLLVQGCLRASLTGDELDLSGLQELHGEDAAYWREEYEGPIFSIREDEVDHLVLTIPSGDDTPVCQITHRGFDASAFNDFVDGLFAAFPDLIAVDDLASDDSDASIRAFGLELGDDYRLAIAVNIHGLNSTSITVYTPTSLEAEDNA